MRRYWQTGLSTVIALTLLAMTLPVDAKEREGRQGPIEIEAKKQTMRQQTAGSSALFIIQLSGPVQEEWKEEIEDLDVKLGDYLPDFAFVAKLARSSDQKKLERLSFVKSVKPFSPVSKISPARRSAFGKEQAAEVAMIRFDDDSSNSRMIGKAGKRTEESSHEMARMTREKKSGQALEEFVLSEDIVALVPIPQNTLRNDVASTILHVDELSSSGYRGRGQIIGVADTGLDTGDEDSLHPDLQGQVERLHTLGRPGDASDLNGHGTHITGSILGTGAASEGKRKGMAPEAKLVFHSIENEEEGLETDVERILSEAYEDGARIHSDSWGDDDEGEYSYTSYLFDKFLWDHPDMIALVAAGNVGDNGYQTIGSPATAKNVIAVGATENERPRFGSQSDDADDVWRFSSRGLTEDGRIKPDLVAPGTSILSVRSSLAPGKNFDQMYDEHYAYMTGTSMSTAILAGGVAQVREFLNEQGEKTPSAALIKAILLSSADELNEDMRLQGYGRANLKSAIQTNYLDEKKGLRTKEKASFAIEVTDDSKPLAITLAWTDYPASLAAKRALVNDLNLTVTTPKGKKLNGNDFFQAPFDDEVDNLNNVEQIWIKEPEKGEYKVVVQGYNIPKGPQPFAIATTGEWAEKPEQPPAKTPKEDTYRGTVDTEKNYREYTIRLMRDGDVKLTAEWAEKADVNLFLYNRKKELIAASTSKVNPEKLEVKNLKSGLYKIRVELKKGEKARFLLSLLYPGRW